MNSTIYVALLRASLEGASGTNGEMIARVVLKRTFASLRLVWVGWGLLGYKAKRQTITPRRLWHCRQRTLEWKK